MKAELALRLLGTVMNWDDDRAHKEFRWLRIMAQYKYDGYHAYLAGARFAESLLSWLQQFSENDREIAYDFVRNHLVYIGTAELHHVVELVYPETIRRGLVSSVSKELSIEPYRIWVHEDGPTAYKTALRKTLFIGLSDGARMDAFRRANSQVINNEQVIANVETDDEKWDSVLEHLRRDLGDDEATFQAVYLIDDFVGSGKTLLREDEKGEWKGKLVKFLDRVGRRKKCLSENWTLHIHHYIATSAAKKSMQDCESRARLSFGEQWFSEVEFTFGMIFPEDFAVSDATQASFLSLVDAHYDPSIENQHSSVGNDGFCRGFGRCSLPLILEHNTPNNSLALLWAESDGSSGHHAMRPLFRRRQRHT